MLKLSVNKCNNSISVQNDDRKKRPRTAFSASQIKALETEFERGKYLSVAKRTALAKQLRLTETQVIMAYSIKMHATTFPIFHSHCNDFCLLHSLW